MAAGVFTPASSAALRLGKARHYVALGLPATAATPEIKRSFRDLARAHHPDRHVGSATAGASAELFKRISAAYEALRDGDSRKAYQRAVLAGRAD